MAQAAAKNEAPKVIDTAEVIARGLPQVRTNMVTVNAEGFAWREIMVRMPADAIADDLKEPSIWRDIQHSAKRLYEDDHLYIKAFDRSWAAEAVVASVNLEGATLGTFKIIKMHERTKPFLNDGTYRVILHGVGFAVERIADGQIMSEVMQNEKLAERELVDLYPAIPVSEAGAMAGAPE